MRRLISFLFPSLIFAAIVFFSLGCPKGSGPTITLKAVNCPKDSIQVEASLTVSGTSPNMLVKLEAFVTCNGRPIPNPEVKLEFWWPNGTFKAIGDGDGKVTHTKGGLHSHPGKQTVPITVKGSDGEKEIDVELPAPGQ